MELVRQKVFDKIQGLAGFVYNQKDIVGLKIAVAGRYYDSGKSAMLIQQKEALFTLLSGLIFIILKTFLIPDLGAFNLELTLVLLALFNVSLWAIRIFLGFRFKALNEMDKTIRYQAGMIAIHGVLIVVFIYAAVLYLIYRETLIVPLQQVLNLAYYSWISLYVFWTASILVLYKRGVLKV